jgi:hypothetical protein
MPCRNALLPFNLAHNISEIGFNCRAPCAKPSFTLSGATGATGSQPYVVGISKTGIFIKTQSGTASVNYRATGS